MYKIVPKEGKTVRYAFERFIAGDTIYSIAKHLRTIGVVGKNGVPVYPSMISKILANDMYIGILTFQKGFAVKHKEYKSNGELSMHIVEGIVEPLISEEDFASAQLRKRENIESSLRKPRNVTGLSGKLKCGSCGASLCRIRSGSGFVWKCNTASSKTVSTCDLPVLHERELIAQIGRLFGDFYDISTIEKLSRIVVYYDKVIYESSDRKPRVVPRDYSPYVYSCFTHKTICGICGKSMVRSPRKRRDGTRRYSWVCRNRQCTRKPLPENELIGITRQALAVHNYSGVFYERVRSTTVNNDSIDFIMKDGEIISCPRE